MEKICEFCTALRPAVYCKADAAYLCLSCDAKVHSANAVSNRHLRTLLCDSCKYRPAYARCLDHRMFMCRGCDQNLHGVSSQHQKRLVSSFVGCPSAKDFAALWGFDLNALDKIAVQDKLFSTSCVSEQHSVADFNVLLEPRPQIGASSTISKLDSTLVFGAESGSGSSSQQKEISYERGQQQNTSFILRQILDLKQLQLNEVNMSSPLMHDQDETNMSSSILKTLKKLDDNLDHLQHSQDLGVDLQEIKVDSMALPFSQQELSPLSSTAANPLLGEFFCQCKSTVESSQFWSQNMQDLGVCEDNICRDDFNIPDVDTTFCNFEELFGGDPDPIRALLDDKDVSYSCVDKDMWLVDSDNGNERLGEEASVASSAHMNKDKGLSNQGHDFPKHPSSPWMIRPYYSNLSFSISSLGAESSGTEYLHSGLSPITGGEASCRSLDLEGAHSVVRKNATRRYKVKNQAARQHEKQGRYAPRRARSDVRKRVKSRLPRKEGCDSDALDVTRSY